MKRQGRAGGGERVVRRYENRKLYDVQARRYVTLEGLARLVRAGEDVRVVDLKTDEDITNLVLAQVVLEGLRRRTADIPHQVLSLVIRMGSDKAGGLREWLDAPQASARARHEAEQIVSRLVARGRLTLEEALGLRQEIASAAQRLVADAQSGARSAMRRLEGLLVPAPLSRRAAPRRKPARRTSRRARNPESRRQR